MDEPDKNSNNKAGVFRALKETYARLNPSAGDGPDAAKQRLDLKSNINKSIKHGHYETFNKYYEDLCQLAKKSPETEKLRLELYEEVTAGARERILPPGHEHETITREMFNKHIAQKKSLSQELTPN